MEAGPQLGEVTDPDTLPAWIRGSASLAAGLGGRGRLSSPPAFLPPRAGEAGGAGRPLSSQRATGIRALPGGRVPCPHHYQPLRVKVGSGWGPSYLFPERLSLWLDPSLHCPPSPREGPGPAGRKSGAEEADEEGCLLRRGCAWRGRGSAGPLKGLGATGEKAKSRPTVVGTGLQGHAPAPGLPSACLPGPGVPSFTAGLCLVVLAGPPWPGA